MLKELIPYTVPAIVTGIIAYLFFKEHVENETKRQLYKLKQGAQKHIIPNKLQAYERLVLLLERMSPNKLTVRVAPISEDKTGYENLLIATIEQEFEHNLAQQIYVSPSCWNVILTAKNSTIQLIRRVSLSEKVTSSEKLREAILTEMMDITSPSQTAIDYLKNEIKTLF